MENNIMDKSKIFKLFILAFVSGMLVLFVAVMPAEYGLDPLGTGKAFGFSKLSEAQKPHKEEKKEQIIEKKSFPILTMDQAGSKPEVALPKEALNPAPKKQYTEREDEIQLIIPANKGLEYKFDVLKYGKVKYEWATADRSTVFFDFHGEVKEKKVVHPVFYESYTVAYSDNMIGMFTSPFEGKHGWYFRNMGKKDVVIKIKLKGQYKLRK